MQTKIEELSAIGIIHIFWNIIRKYPAYQGGFIWDFVDQAQWWTADAQKTGSDHVFIFGGEFNDVDPSDKAFCCNGIIAADRSLHPHAYEVAYQYRSILTSAVPADALEGMVQVYNENFFIDLSRYMLQWNVQVNGRQVLSGVVTDLNVGPQQTAAVALGYTADDIKEAAGLDTLEGLDVHLNVSYHLRRNDGILAAGTQVAYDQIVVCEASQPVFDSRYAKASKR
mgnify:CR=1 FL=1